MVIENKTKYNKNNYYIEKNIEDKGGKYAGEKAVY